MKINGIILAAGHSSRLGQDKQLVKFNGNPLIHHTEKMLHPVVNHLFVVLGHNHETIKKEIKAATCLVNEKWQLGMGTSLSCGISQAQNHADAILIALCDQPRIPVSHYSEMIVTATQNPTKIIATAYQEISGVPAIFPKQYFSALCQLNGQQGAQHLIAKNHHAVIDLTCESAAFDVDKNSHLADLQS